MRRIAIAMKFLCVDCDEQMILEETRGPDDGSMTVVFCCTSCGRKIAMLTNSMETQMVHSLGVKIGRGEKTVAPMETIRSSLVGYHGASENQEAATESNTESNTASNAEPATESSGGESANVGGCPFSAMLSGPMEDSKEAAPDSMSSGSDVEPTNGTGEDAVDSASELQWTPEAEERMDRIPSFVRAMVQKGIEDYAHANDITLVDGAILKEVRERFGF